MTFARSFIFLTSLLVLLFIQDSQSWNGWCTKEKMVTECERNGNPLAVDGPNVELKCQKKQVILVIDANYGRTEPSNKTCRYLHRITEKNLNHTDDTNCIGAESVERVSAFCDGRQQCKVEPTNKVFGDPCYGTYKYLTVSYLCQPERGFFTDTELNCPKGYGILLKKLIGVDKENRRSVLKKTRKQCNNYQTCSIGSQNQKYPDLRVGYLCKGLEVFQETACERNGRVNPANMELSCPRGRCIQVVSANYGRTVPSRQTCSYPDRHIDDTACGDPSSSLAKVSDLCDRKQTCSVAPTNRVFGDPCRGTYKYLQVTYVCRTRY